jgi:hypothetical protein
MTDKGGLKMRRWMRFPSGGGRPKSGSEPLVAPEGRETENRFYGGERGYPEPTPLLGRVA